MEITYTDTAQAELKAFNQRQQNLLQEVIKSRKYIFGDDIIEITASDIRDAERYIRLVNVKQSRSTFMRHALLQVYLVGGILTTLAGFLYPYIQELMSKNPTQLMLVLTGLILSLMSLFMQFYMKYRDDRRKKIYHEMMLEENRIFEKMDNQQSN